MIMIRIFALLLIIPTCAMAYALDGFDDEDDLSTNGTTSQQAEFQVPPVEVKDQPIPKYTIGPLDLLEIEVFRVAELSRVVRVSSEGTISLPLVGTIKVTGYTVEEVGGVIQKHLEKEYLQDPYVSVFIKEYESQKITINGWVESPGIFPLKGKTTLIQALSIAGGIKRLGDPTDVVIFREKPGVGTTGYKINFEEVQAGLISDPILQSHDIIVVPENGSKAAFEYTAKSIGTFLGFLPYL